MIDMSALTTALYTKLLNNAALISASVEVERSTRINFDPARCPWIGVYPGLAIDSPRVMSSSSAWKDEAELQVVVQTASFSNDGTAASDSLEGIIKAVQDAIVADLTLGVVGVRVLKFSREYRYVLFDDDGAGQVFMPQAIVKVNLEART